METLGIYSIPVMIFIIIFIGIINNVPIFDTFIKGAREGIYTSFTIMPSLIGLITAISMLKASGAFDIFINIILPFSNFLHIPSEVIPIAILRPISGSGSIALLDNILSTYGPDSIIGKIASIIMGATETTFYTLAIYFGSVGIKNSKYTLYSALIGDFTIILISVIIVKFFNLL